MTSIFADNLFLKSTLTTADKKNTIVCTLRDSQSRYLADLLRQDSKGSLVGRIVDPAEIPGWLVPGTVLYGVVQGMQMTLTYDGVIQSRIEGLTDLLGDKVRFSYVVTSEFS
jgi:hypothetical protein